MLPIEREIAALKFIDGLSAQLRDVRELQQSLRLALRSTREFFDATRGCIARLQAGRVLADPLFRLPKEANWDLDALTRFIRQEHPPVEPHMMIGALRRRGGAWGAIAVVREPRPFDREDRHLLLRIAGTLSDAIHLIDRDRIRDVRDRIDRKIMEQIHPRISSIRSSTGSDR